MTNDYLAEVTALWRSLSERSIEFDVERLLPLGPFQDGLALLTRAVALVESHGLVLPMNGPDKSLCITSALPILPQHSVRTPNAAFVFDEDAGELRLVALADLAPGEIVTVSRRCSMTNAEMLVSFGQVPDDNPNETIELNVIAAVAFPNDDVVDLFCSEMPEIAHAFVASAPGAVPDRLLRDLGVTRTQRLLQAVSDVLDIGDDDHLGLVDSHCSEACSIDDLIGRYRQQLAILIQRARTTLSKLDDSRS